MYVYNTICIYIYTYIHTYILPQKLACAMSAHSPLDLSCCKPRPHPCLLCSVLSLLALLVQILTAAASRGHTLAGCAGYSVYLLY